MRHCWLLWRWNVANASAVASIIGTSEIVNLTATNGGPGGDFILTENGGGIAVTGGDNGSSLDFIFFSTFSDTGVPGCPEGCIMSFDVTSGRRSTSGYSSKRGVERGRRAPWTAPTDLSPAASSSITIWCRERCMGTSQIYFLTLDNAAGALQHFRSQEFAPCKPRKQA